jgi:hypothetical protein
MGSNEFKDFTKPGRLFSLGAFASWREPSFLQID